MPCGIGSMNLMFLTVREDEPIADLIPGLRHALVRPAGRLGRHVLCGDCQGRRRPRLCRAARRPQQGDARHHDHQFLSHRFARFDVDDFSSRLLVEPRFAAWAPSASRQANTAPHLGQTTSSPRTCVRPKNFSAEQRGHRKTMCSALLSTRWRGTSCAPGANTINDCDEEAYLVSGVLNRTSHRRVGYRSVTPPVTSEGLSASADLRDQLECGGVVGGGCAHGVLERPADAAVQAPLAGT